MEFVIAAVLIFCAVQLLEIARQLVFLRRLTRYDFEMKYGTERMLHAQGNNLARDFVEKKDFY